MGELDLGGAGCGGQVGLELGRVGHAHARKKKEGFGVCKGGVGRGHAHARKKKEGSGVCKGATKPRHAHAQNSFVICKANSVKKVSIW